MKKAKKHISRRLRRFARATEAVSALEYAVLVGVVAVAIGAALVAFSNDVQEAIANLGDNVAAVNTTSPTTITPDTTAN